MSTWIKGIGGYLPERVVTSEELEEMDFSGDALYEYLKEDHDAE